MKSQNPITNLVPFHWFKRNEASSIWITAYRILLADIGQMKSPRIYDFSNARVIISFGQLQYLNAKNIHVEIDNDGNFKFDGSLQADVTPEGGWLLIVQPYIVDGVELNEYEIRARSGSYAALYGAINGRNMAFERVFDNIAALSDGKSTASSPSFINPHAFPRPNLSYEELDLIHKAGKLIDEKEPRERKKFELSLHWFEKGMRSMGLDGFVNYWVALETLGMDDTTNIKPLNKSLARAYEITEQDAANKFGVGKIFGLRSQILHNGEDLAIHQLLSEYLEGLFVDVLFDHLGMVSKRKTQLVLDNPGFDLNKLLHI